MTENAALYEKHKENAIKSLAQDKDDALAQNLKLIQLLEVKEKTIRGIVSFFESDSLDKPEFSVSTFKSLNTESKKLVKVFEEDLSDPSKRMRVLNNFLIN